MAPVALETLAPCVVVAGPPNSGKTTFVHQIDEALQRHPSLPLVYVVKGSPDSTGRYLYYAPELRERVETDLKGRWAPPQTVETICSWILNARRSLDLVILDFGGRHSPVNSAILPCCTHYLVVARTFSDDPEKEQREGMGSWDRACLGQGLLPVAGIRSLWKEGDVRVWEAADSGEGPLRATYRADAADPGDATNGRVVEAVAERLLGICPARRVVPYLDLRLNRSWEAKDLPDLAGLLPELANRVQRDATAKLGGRAPMWAYLAVMHRALDFNEEAHIDLFEPKWPGAFIRIPALHDNAGSAFPPNCLEVSWRSERAEQVLDLRIATPDRFLPAMLALFLESAPLPEREIPKGSGVTVNGPCPLWIHMAYSRWLRSAGAERISIWDARSRSPVQVHPLVASPALGV